MFSKILAILQIIWQKDFQELAKLVLPLMRCIVRFGVLVQICTTILVKTGHYMTLSMLSKSYAKVDE
jgi:ABC-type anion transport system duplicated permease subunit